MTEPILTLPRSILGMQVARPDQVADAAAAARTLEKYRAGLAQHTRRRHNADLALFAGYLVKSESRTGEDLAQLATRLATDPSAWAGVSWGMLDGFIEWQLVQGYAVASVNVRLATAKTYAGLAAKAGAIDAGAYALIRTVIGYRPGKARRVDEARAAQGLKTRLGRKKKEWVSLTREQATALKQQPDTPQGRRDALLMCLLLDHGLRCGEVAALKVTDFDLPASELRFYREKVGKTQIHSLTPATQRAARAYFKHDALALGALLRGSRKDGQLQAAGMIVQAITRRIGVLGRAIGLAGLSPHDLRHAWATTAARHGTPLDRLQDAGGWASPAMPLRYIEAARIANQGVLLE